MVKSVRAGRAMKLLRQGPVPFAERENESVTKASEAEPRWTDSGAVPVIVRP